MDETELVEEICWKKDGIEHVLDEIFIEQLLMQLPVELREVISLYYFQELKLTEIADVLQIGLPLVKYRLRRAKKQLTQLMDKEVTSDE